MTPNNDQANDANMSMEPDGQPRQWRRKTALLHAGYHPKDAQGVVMPPEHRASTMAFSTAEKGARSFQLAWGYAQLEPGERPEYIYSRVSHPDATIVEARLVGMEPGAGRALVFNSGMSAITDLLTAMWHCDKMPTGSHLLYTNPVYGGTEGYFKECLPRLGITPHEVCTDNLAATAEAMEKIIATGGKLAMVYLETPANPTLTMTDIAAVAVLAKQCNPDCLVVVDNTFFGIFQQPFVISPHVDAVVYSATKFIGGHADLIAGAVIVPVGKEALLDPVLGMRVMHGTIAPAAICTQMIRSMGTLHIRMEEEAKNASIVAAALNYHPQVAEIKHPSLFTPAHSMYQVYHKQATGPGSMITIDLKPSPAQSNPAEQKKADRAKAFQFLDTVNQSGIIALAVSLGGVETLIEHPASMTHSEVAEDIRLAAGITELTIRLSVGLEDPQDLVEVLVDALDALS